METAGDRGVREDIAQDDQIADLLQRRRAVAEAHSRPLTRADHQRFDRAIRAAPAAAPVARVKARPAMRQAFIWAEILGKPVADRER